jgi:ABC-type nitrate/sulfonate/bicarbonate transport system substrate-binding protein
MNDIKLIVFPGAPNLPIFVAREKSFFAEAGARIELSTTPSSVYQIENLTAGKYDIAGTAFDNVVAYQEGQGAVALAGQSDLFVFMGATQIELALIVQPEVDSYEKLKGKSLALDAVATGFAFILYAMLERAGLKLSDCQLVPVGATPQRWESVKSGQHAGTLTIEPFTSVARSQGFKILETSATVVDSYQGGIFTARRSWAAANPSAVKAFVAGYLKGLAWSLDPQNRAEAADILSRNMPDIRPQAIENVMKGLLSPRSGLTPAGAILPDGMKTVVDLRNRYGGKPIANTDPARYVDLRYYNHAVKEQS